MREFMSLEQTMERFLGGLATVEVLAILRYTKILIEQGKQNNRIYICSGRAAINDLTKTTRPQSHLFGTASFK